MTTTLRRTFSMAALAGVVLMLPLAGCRKEAAESTEPAADTTMMAPAMGGTVADVAMADTQFSTLVELIQAAGIADQLKSAGPFTVFAPTNAAFAALPAGTIDTLKLEKNKQKLTDILLYHVVAGNMKAADVKGMQSLTTSSANASLPVTVEGETVKVGDATVTTADVSASNGTIHVIDKVLMPPTAM